MPTKTVLVTGGAGFIGSHMCLLLKQSGYNIVIFDNLQTGFTDAVFGNFVEGDLKNRAEVEALFEEYEIDAVMHFAASTSVGDSVKEPAAYYENNVVGTLNLLEAMTRFSVSRLIFSSTAAVYGEPKRMPILEQAAKEPCNPYGRTKWICEQLLQDFPISSIAFRYFNAAGGDAQQRTGERRNPLSHLIPIVLEVAQKKRPFIELFGDDYETRDGSCVRDFVHVSDICEAHLLGLKRLFEGEFSSVYNLGSGSGHSVLEVVEMARQLTKKEIPLQVGKRRVGDCMELIASSELAKRELGWEPKRSDLQTMILDTWRWMEHLQSDAALTK